MDHQRIWPQQDSLDPAENCCVGPYTDCQAKYCQNRKTRIARQHSQAKANVLPELLKQRTGSNSADFFFHLLHTSSFQQCGPPCRYRRESGGDLFFREQLDIGAHLHFQFALHLLLAEQVAQQAGEAGPWLPPEYRHGLSSSR